MEKRAKATDMNSLDGKARKMGNTKILNTFIRKGEGKDRE